LLKAYRERATLVRPQARSRPVCRDRDDDKVLETAVAGQADIILTGDRDLLVLGEYKGIRILSPRQFVELMDRRG
jgi:putative PIN family toxin of toxin-antitoxin system